MSRRAQQLLVTAAVGAAASVRIGAQETRRAPADVAFISIDSTVRASLLQAFRASNAELEARRAALAASEARLRSAGFAPPAAFSAEIEEVPGVNVADAGSARVDVARTFLGSSVPSARRALAATDVDRARIALELTERHLLAQADQHVTLVLASAAIASQLAGVDSLLAAAELALRTRFAAGDARYVDVLRLRTERLQTQTERAAAVADVRSGRRGFITLFGDTVSAFAQALLDSLVTRGLATVVQQPTATGVPTPLPSPPSVESLLAVSGAARLGAVEVQRAEAARRLALAEQRPQISASLGVQRFARDGGGRDVGPTAGVTLSLPFTARTANARAVAAAEREADAARASRRAALAATRAELAAARERYEAIRERLGLYDAALLRGAREERETALAAYRNSELSLVELLDFERALTRAEIARLEGLIEAARALADFYGSAAQPLEPTPNEPLTPRREGVR